MLDWIRKLFVPRVPVCRRCGRSEREHTDDEYCYMYLPGWKVRT
jgi:ribosomal protein L32